MAHDISALEINIFVDKEECSNLRVGTHSGQFVPFLSDQLRESSEYRQPRTWVGDEKGLARTMKVDATDHPQGRRGLRSLNLLLFFSTPIPFPRRAKLIQVRIIVGFDLSLSAWHLRHPRPSLSQHTGCMTQFYYSRTKWTQFHLFPGLPYEHDASKSDISISAELALTIE